MKKDTPGCATLDCCGPCCSQGWALLRSHYSHCKHTYTGNDPALLAPSPLITDTDLVATVVVGGVTQYQCNCGGGGAELLIEVPDYYGPSTDPRIMGAKQVVDPNTGLHPYSYGYGQASISASSFNCEQIYVTVTCGYDVYRTADPSGDLMGAGFTFDIGGYWIKTDGDYTHKVTQLFSFGSPINVWRIESVYAKFFVGAAAITTIPATIDVVPPWNPFGKSSKLELS